MYSHFGVGIGGPPLLNGYTRLHRQLEDLFLNAIEYPVVSASEQRFRISVMSSHSRSDLDRLVEVIEEVWSIYAVPQQADLALAA